MAQALSQTSTEPAKTVVRVRLMSSPVAVKRARQVERMRAKAAEADDGKMRLLTGLSDEEKLTALRGR